MCSKQVREWLVLLTMEQYVHRLFERGYMTIAQCQKIFNSDLIMLGIDDQSHRQLMLAGVQLLNNSPHLFACTEPCDLHAPNPKQLDVFENLMETCKAKSQANEDVKLNIVSEPLSPTEAKLDKELLNDWTDGLLNLPIVPVPLIELHELFDLEFNDMLDLNIPIGNLPMMKDSSPTKLKTNNPIRIDSNVIVID